MGNGVKAITWIVFIDLAPERQFLSCETYLGWIRGRREAARPLPEKEEDSSLKSKWWRFGDHPFFFFPCFTWVHFMQLFRIKNSFVHVCNCNLPYHPYVNGDMARSAGRPSEEPLRTKAKKIVLTLWHVVVEHTWYNGSHHISSIYTDIRIVHTLKSQQPFPFISAATWKQNYIASLYMFNLLSNFFHQQEMTSMLSEARARRS